MARKTFDLYVVEENNGRSYWKQVGGGFTNADDSISLKLHMFPGLLIQCREHVPREERDAGTDQRGERRGTDRGGRR